MVYEIFHIIFLRRTPATVVKTKCEAAKNRNVVLGQSPGTNRFVLKSKFRQLWRSCVPLAICETR